VLLAASLCYDVGMADNPYQAPQTRREVTLLLPAWRRLVSIPLIMFGGFFTLNLVLIIGGTLVELVIKIVTGRMSNDVPRNEILIYGLALGPIAPGLVFSGLAMRRIVRGRPPA
jgi:hypothetical protein